MQFDYTSVGKRIQHYRTSLNKTQEELAEQADISKNYLSKLENAQARGRLDKYYSVAQALGVTVDMLIDNSSDRCIRKRLLLFKPTFTACFFTFR